MSFDFTIKGCFLVECVHVTVKIHEALERSLMSTDFQGGGFHDSGGRDHEQWSVDAAHTRFEGL